MAMPRRLFSVSQILKWADAFRKRSGEWPKSDSGLIHGGKGDTWRRVDSALRLGLRGLPGGSSLAQLLAKRRGVENSGALPLITTKQIVAWADAFYRRSGNWPRETSGLIDRANGESWFAVDRALRAGVRGLSAGSSLARLLAQRRGVRNIKALPHMTVKQILAWADAYHRRTGTWPTPQSGPIRGTKGETWSGVNAALQSGRRGFPGGYSLPRLLASKRGLRNPKQPPPLTVQQILRWAQDHLRRTGRRPNLRSGPIPQAPGETWSMVNRALVYGRRGLRKGTSLYRLLRKHGMKK